MRTSLAPLLGLIDGSGRLSGFTINWEKSVFMPLSDDLDSSFLNNLPFSINIPRNPKLLLKHNYLDLVDGLKRMIDNWKLLPLLIIGRVNIIKMVVLPKFTYFCQNMPIFVTSSLFKTLDYNYAFHLGL